MAAVCWAPRWKFKARSGLWSAGNRPVRHDFCDGREVGDPLPGLRRDPGRDLNRCPQVLHEVTAMDRLVVRSAVADEQQVLQAPVDLTLRLQLVTWPSGECGVQRWRP